MTKHWSIQSPRSALSLQVIGYSDSVFCCTEIIKKAHKIELTNERCQFLCNVITRTLIFKLFGQKFGLIRIAATCVLGSDEVLQEALLFAHKKAM
jgi:hypothetical protein